jgi:hypothetical protein
MAISQEEFDKINVGDYVVVARKLYGEWKIESGEAYVAPGCSSRFLSVEAHNIAPSLGGEHAVLIEHKPKPVPPAWHNAKVIKTGSNTPVYWVRRVDGMFLGSNTVVKDVESFATEPQIVVE